MTGIRVYPQLRGEFTSPRTSLTVASQELAEVLVHLMQGHRRRRFDATPLRPESRPHRGSCPRRPVDISPDRDGSGGLTWLAWAPHRRSCPVAISTSCCTSGSTSSR